MQWELLPRAVSGFADASLREVYGCLRRISPVGPTALRIEIGLWGCFCLEGKTQASRGSTRSLTLEDMDTARPGSSRLGLSKKEACSEALSSSPLLLSRSEPPPFA